MQGKDRVGYIQSMFLRGCKSEAVPVKLKTPGEAGKQQSKPESKNEVVLGADQEISNGSFQRESRKQDLAGAVQMVVCDIFGIAGKILLIATKDLEEKPGSVSCGNRPKYSKKTRVELNYIKK